jgi:hypothetical protein
VPCAFTASVNRANSPIVAGAQYSFSVLFIEGIAQSRPRCYLLAVRLKLSKDSAPRDRRIANPLTVKAFCRWTKQSRVSACRMFVLPAPLGPMRTERLFLNLMDVRSHERKPSMRTAFKCTFDCGMDAVVDGCVCAPSVQLVLPPERIYCITTRKNWSYRFGHTGSDTTG